MELHTYAKRRPSKKWTVVQKRKLVEARITYDSIFSKKPLKCLATWKKIVSLAKLDDFNVPFVRRQWSNMIAKYKKYKRSRLGNLAANAIDDELLRKVSKEWEFFYHIHTFMSRKITHLHSYALEEGQKQKQPASNALTQQQQQEQNKNNASLASQLENMLANNNESPQEIGPAQKFPFFGSDTNDDYAAAEIVASETVGAIEPAAVDGDAVGQVVAQNALEDAESNQQKKQNTDHDSYSKKAQKQKNDTLVSVKTDQDQENSSVLQESKKNANPAITTITNGGNSQTNVKSLRKKPTLKAVADTDKKPINARRRTSKRLRDESCSNSDDEPAVSSKCRLNNIANNNHGPGPSHSANTNQQQFNKVKLSERDKYYRHKRRYNRRLEHRFDKLLNVFGQIVKAEYPNIDVCPLLGTTSPTVDNYMRFPDQDQFNGNHNDSEVYSQELSSSEDSEESTLSSSAADEESGES